MRKTKETDLVLFARMISEARGSWLFFIALSCLLAVSMAFVILFEYVFAEGCELELAEPVLKSPDAYRYLPVTEGRQYIITTTLGNCKQADIPLVLLTEARNSEGVTEFLGSQSATLMADDRLEVGVTWIPAHAGSYELRSFVISDLEEPEILSSVGTSISEIAGAISPTNRTDPDRIESIKGRFLISHKGIVTMISNTKPEQKYHEVNFDMSGNFARNGTEYGLALDANNVILSLGNEENDDVLVVYGFDHHISISADCTLLTYGATLNGYARGNVTGTFSFDSPICSELADGSISSESVLKAVVNGRIYESMEPSRGTLVLVPHSQIHSVTVDKPADPTFSFLKSTIVEKETTSVNPIIALDVSLEHSANATSADLSPTSLIFSVENTGTSPATLAIDKWVIQYGGGGDSPSYQKVEVPEGQIVLMPSELLTITKLDLSERYHSPVVAPETYNISLRGVKWYEKDFGAYKKLGNWDEYLLNAKLNREYDIDTDNLGILYTNNMLLRINGTSGDPFVVEDDFVKSVEIFIVNNNSGKMSRLVHSDSVAVWPLDDRPAEASYGGIADYFGDYQCEYLEKGETERSGSVAMSGSYWPIGKNGIAREVGSLEAPPGIYILSASAYTLPCELENGEKVPAGSHSLVAAFELR